MVVKYTSVRTDERGMVWVTAPGEPEHALTLGLQMAKKMDAVIAQWEPLSIKHEARTGVHRGWTLAMYLQESEGNPRAFRQEPKRRDEVAGWTGIGLLQITHPSLKGRKRIRVSQDLYEWVGGHSDSELMDPELNTRIGVDYILNQKNRYGDNFHRIAAAFNHGSVEPSDLNAFGMVSTGLHIATEVGALNYYLARGLAPEQLVSAVRVIPDEEILAQNASMMASWTRDQDWGHGSPNTEEPTDPQMSNPPKSS